MELNELIERVMNNVEKTADIRAVFGDPYEKDGITIIPVAKVQVAGGGGGGSGQADENHKPKGRGIGLGLNVSTTPLGYIEVIDSEARFVRILDLNRIILVGIVVGSIAWMLVARAAISKTR